MYTNKSFVKFRSFANNAPGQTAALGELASLGLTYSREIGEYSLSEYNEPIVMSFFSSADGEQISIPVALYTVSLEISQWLYECATEGTTSSDAGEFTRLFNGEFDTRIGDFEMGPMVSNAKGHWMPSWISFQVLEEDPNRIKLWFANDSFLNQYDEFELVFVPPIDVLDNFFQSRARVQEELDQVTQKMLTDRINTLSGNKPYTELRTDLFAWHDSNNRTITTDVYWTTLIYGPAGDNLDVIKQQLVEWILAQSEFDRDSWVKTFPDLFTNTEFILTPLWSQYAIPNKRIESGMYSPVVNPKKALSLTKQTIQGSGYSNAHIEDYIRHVPVSFKSLVMTAVGCNENRDGIFDFYERFTDYLDLPTSSIDFGRMSVTTQNWVLLLMKLLKAAEVLTPTSDVPVGINRLMRDNILYASAGFDNIQYLVTTAYSVEAIEPPHVGDQTSLGQTT